VTVRPLRLYEGNDEILTVSIGRAGAAYSLAGSTVEMIIKSSVSDAEGTYPDASVVVLSTATGEITVTDAAAGTVTVDINAADLATPGTMVYRIDVIDGTGRRTAIHGDLLVVDL
jgi:hypothetical protein